MKDAQSATESAADGRAVARQIEVELAMLLAIKQALRIAVEWRPEDAGNVRKLSTLRFVAGSFERHLHRLRILAEHGGYLHLVTRDNPHLTSDVLELRERRDALQVRWEDIALRLEHVAPASDDFAGLCIELSDYLHALEAHGQQEMELFQHSFTQEEGGHG